MPLCSTGETATTGEAGGGQPKDTKGKFYIMFGIRPDGRELKKGVDPITRFTPLIMRQRCDAQVMTTEYIDAEKLNEYIRKRKKDGVKLSHMTVIIAAILRTAAQYPMMNRYVVNGKLYSRNEYTVSFVAVKSKDLDTYDETTTKTFFDYYDTVDTVQKRIDKTIEEARDAASSTAVVNFANGILSIPVLPRLILDILMFMDRIGILPKKILDISPFHTSLFITNMASLKMNDVFHHIYNFGTTSIFVGMGKRRPQLHKSIDGTLSAKWVYPVGVVVDERIMPGAQFAKCFQTMIRYMNNPELLEAPPEEIVYDIGIKPYRLKPSYDVLKGEK